MASTLACVCIEMSKHTAEGKGHFTIKYQRNSGLLFFGREAEKWEYCETHAQQARAFLLVFSSAFSVEVKASFIESYDVALSVLAELFTTPDNLLI